MSRLIKVKLALVDKDHLIANKYAADASGQWERKLNNITPNKLTVGLDSSFSRGGFTLAIGDGDEKFKTMMANDTYRKIYGKPVTIYAYAPDGVTLADTIVASIKDFRRDGNLFRIDCDQEFTSKMSSIPSPRSLTFNAADWPNAPGSTIGQAVPMPEGVQSAPAGVVTAYLVNVIGDIWADWENCRYIYVHTWSDPGGAARCSNVTGVFCEGVETAEGSGGGTWAHSRDANGWELVTISPQPPREGLQEYAPPYMTVNGIYETESSASQNPVGVLNSILTMAGITLVDDGDGGASDFADYCTANSWKHNGRTPDNITTIKEYQETWAHNFDAWWRIASDGTIHIKHIDWTAVTASATLLERHFKSFKETSSKQDFTNRIKMNFNFNPTQSKWQDLAIVDSIDGDYAVEDMLVEKPDENVMFSYTVGASHPVTGQIKFVDHPIYTVACSTSLLLYERLSLGLFAIITATHRNQIGGTGKYFIIDVAPDCLKETVALGMIRLWGV